MSRKLKNLITIALIIGLCIAMYFTLNYQARDFRNMGKMPEMPSGDFNRKEPPEWVKGQMTENINSAENMPDIQNSNNTRPEMSERMERPNNTKDKQMESLNRGNPNFPRNMNDNLERNNTLIKILCVIESIALSAVLIYLIMSNFNKLTFKETLANKNLMIYIILVIGIALAVVIAINILNKNNFIMDKNRMMMPQEESIEKETKPEDVDAGENVETEKINLNDHTSNITLTKAGTYTLTGEFNNSVLVNADGDVTLNLNNITITNDITAAIANISTNKLTLNLLDNTTNNLTDGGSSEYDGCLYSAGPLIITGNGNLNIYGNQEEGEGIATTTQDITINGGNIKIICNDDGINAGGDGGTITINGGDVYIKASGDGIDSNKNIIINGGNVYSMGSALGGDAGIDADEGFEINGGTVIALGSDMLEMPKDTSRQKSLCFNLKSSVESGTSIVLKDSNDAEVVTFTANENFRTLIISNGKLTNGKYTLYANTEKISETEI